MADKEATVYVIDVGKSMGKKRHGRSETDLECAMEYVWDRITTTVSTGRKTACVGVVGFRTDGSQNELAENDPDDAYSRISVFQELGQLLMPQLRELSKKLQPSRTNDGDAISAVVVAVQLIIKFCKHLKYIKKIVVITNGDGAIDEYSLSEIAKKIRQENIDLILLGVDFDDSLYGYQEPDKSATKAQNEKLLYRLTDECGGAFGTLDQAVSELSVPRIKPVRPFVSYRGTLNLGNPHDYETAMCINVERVPCTVIAKAPTASNTVVRSNMASEESQPAAPTENGEADGSRTSLVRNLPTYQIKDEEAPGGKRDVKRDELAKGYEYGRTAVPISEADASVTKLETTPVLEIVGFVPKDNYKRYMTMSNTYMIVGARNNEKAILAMSSFIHALYELDSYAVARFVQKAGSEPRLVLLAWQNLTDYECLYELELPFAEDVRSYKFPPLDKIVTLSGKVLKEHRNLPTDAALSAMDAYVDAMDLSKADRDDEGNHTEFLPLDEVYSPLLHRINQVIKHRAVHPDGPLPPLNDILLKASNPPADLLKNAAPAISKLQEAVDVKKVPPKSLSRKRGGRNTEAPRSGLDIGALLSTHRPQKDPSASVKIDPNNAIPEFKQILESTSRVDVVCAAAGELGDIIQNWISSSLGHANYHRALEAIMVLREGCIDYEEPGVFNDWMRGLKRSVLTGELGGDRREFWHELRAARLGLIERRVAGASHVDEDEAKQFLAVNADA